MRNNKRFGDMFKSLRGKLYRYIQAQEKDTKITAIIAILFVVVAYLPTLQFNYVSQDQWATFLYPLEQSSRFERVSECLASIPGYFYLIGRPFVWLGECVEHVVVAKISDFIFLRPFVILVVLACVFVLGRVIAPLVNGVVNGIVAATFFVLAPGYSFMYFQGMTGVMVLVSLIPAAISFHIANKWITDYFYVPSSKKKLAAQLNLPIWLFVFSCMLYPAWAFIVIPLTLLYFGLDKYCPVSIRIRRALCTIFFYLLASLIYLIIAKAWSWVNFKILVDVHHNQINLAGYNLAMQLNIEILIGRIRDLLIYFWNMPLLNYSKYSIGAGGILFLYFLWGTVKNLINGSLRKYRFIELFFISVIVFIVTGGLLIGAISPWLFSHMSGLGFYSRWILPWNLFQAVVLCVFISALWEHAPGKIRLRVHPVLPLIILLSSAVILQNKLSYVETLVSRVEISAMRDGFSRWVAMPDRNNINHLHIIRPANDQPMFIRDEFSFYASIEDNYVFATRRYPPFTYYMAIAVLKELISADELKSMKFRDCRFKLSCVDKMDKSYFYITQSNQPVQFAKDSPVFIVDLSQL